MSCINKKRLRCVDDESYVYHVGSCYKIYTMKKTTDSIIRKSIDKAEEMEVSEENQSRSSMSMRSEISACSKTSSQIHPDSLNCGSLSVKLKGQKIREKFRICEKDRAALLLRAASYNRDTFFDRVSDLSSVENVFSADIYCHKHCIRKYILNYQRFIDKVPDKDTIPTIAPKRLLFQKAVEHIDPLLENYYSFTVSDITAFMMSLNEGREEMIILNRDVKQL